MLEGMETETSQLAASESNSLSKIPSQAAEQSQKRMEEDVLVQGSNPRGFCVPSAIQKVASESSRSQHRRRRDRDKVLGYGIANGIGVRLPRAPLGTFACYDGVLLGKQALQIFTRRGLKLAPNWDAFGAPALHITRQ